MSDTVEKTKNGAIVYDTAIVSQISEAAFRASGWKHAHPVEGTPASAGRGETMIVGDGENELVLRHYHRGGLIGRVISDVYVWGGEEQTRSFAEWRLLYKLNAMGLPVPRPVAARYRRAGTFYSADLLTVRIPGIEPLSQRIAASTCTELFWFELGQGIHRFHKAGVFHADLNAYNVQLGPRDELWLLDFDRGRLRPPGTWRQQNLARLHRSLRKVRRLNPHVSWNERHWQRFLDGYFQASRSS